uniref:Ig-like domain-containing protein n=1 Tax=Graphocephala atropunctata TaxID=36148 RepID=A0A1B6LEG1_9HEMI
MLRYLLGRSCLKTMLSLFIFFLFGLQGSWCVTNVHMNALPSILKVGGNLAINCTYTLENEEVLYTLKYYINGQELYSYIPKDKIPINVYGIVGADGYVVRDNGVLEMNGVKSDGTGWYQCEVTVNSTSATSFVYSTGFDSTSVTVVVEPLNIPSITTQSENYYVGKKLIANCTSRGGFPLASLTWFVDGKEVTYPGSTKQYTVRGGVNSSVSELTLPIVSKHPNGQLQLSCEASQFTLYNASVEVDLKEGIGSSSEILSPFLGSVVTSAVLTAAAMSIAHLRR